MSIDHAVAAMQIPLSLISIIAESASVQVVGTAMIATVEGFLQVCSAGSETSHPLPNMAVAYSSVGITVYDGRHLRFSAFVSHQEKYRWLHSLHSHCLNLLVIQSHPRFTRFTALQNSTPFDSSQQPLGPRLYV